MADPSEVENEERQLAALAKRMLATPPKRRGDLKVGKPKAESEKEAHAFDVAKRKKPTR